MSLADLDAVAYTTGPGLLGALLVGSTFAKTLAFSINCPALGVHHMEGHLLAPLMDTPIYRCHLLRYWSAVGTPNWF